MKDDGEWHVVLRVDGRWKGDDGSIKSALRGPDMVFSLTETFVLVLVGDTGV